MRVAIIGAGFSGLAVAFHLLSTGRYGEVVLFDAKGIGGGASGISTGLLHPYPGEQGRRSHEATEGLAATKRLLQAAEEALGCKVADQSGIVRIVADEEQKAHFLDRTRLYDDILQIDERSFFIRSGITVYPSFYLEGLWRSCQQRGARFEKRAIESLDELDSFDQIIIAAGAGSLKFKECAPLKLKLVKGQVITGVWPTALPLLERSVVGKGYIARGEAAHTFHLGATYERDSTSEDPDPLFALADLKPKFSSLLQTEETFQLIDCRAAFRVTHQKNYLPIAQQVSGKAYVLTAMGSRGLLYHALYAEKLLAML